MGLVLNPIFTLSLCPAGRLCSAGDQWVINTAVEHSRTSPSLASVFRPWSLDGETERGRHIDRKGLEVVGDGRQSRGAGRREKGGVESKRE